MAIIVALFMGWTVSAEEEIIRDRKILKRESFLNLSWNRSISCRKLELFYVGHSNIHVCIGWQFDFGSKRHDVVFLVFVYRVMFRKHSRPQYFIRFPTRQLPFM